MMYRILLDGHDIYGPNPETAVIDPHLDIELNSAGSLEFTLPVDNYDWDTPQVFTNEVEVIEDGEVIFFGRPLQITRDWNNQKKVVCEGALAYFNDTIQRTHEYKTSSHTTLEAFFRHLIDVHNSQVDDQIGSSYSPKHFEVGTVDLENKGKYVYRKTDYQTTLECLQQMCLDTDGGYFVLRKEYDNDGNATRYIDWLEQMPYGADQPVQFGLNLLDLSRDLNGADICTVLIPLGGENLNLSNFSSKDPDDPNNIYPGVGHVRTSDEIYYKPGVELYGRVVKQKTWSDYTSQDGLWRKAAEWLTRKNEYIPTIEVDAADLHYIDEYKDHGESLYSVFKVGMAVQVISKPHGFDEDTIDGESHPNLIIHKLSLDLDSATKKVTIGTPPKRELTDILAPSSGGKTTKGSGGNGDDGPIYSVSEIYPVTEIMIKKEGETEYSSAIANKTAYIDLTTGVGGNVKDVQVDEVSIVDENGIANLDSSAFGTDVEANPSETPSEHLTAIEIDGTVYDIPGGGGGAVTDVIVHGQSIIDENGIVHLGDMSQQDAFGYGDHAFYILSWSPTNLTDTRSVTMEHGTDSRVYFDLRNFYQRYFKWDDCFKFYIKDVIESGTIVHEPHVGFQDGNWPMFGLKVGEYTIGKQNDHTGSPIPEINFVGRNGIRVTPNSPGGSVSWWNDSVDVTVDYIAPERPNYEKILFDSRHPEDLSETTTTTSFVVEETGCYILMILGRTSSSGSVSISIDGSDYTTYFNDSKSWTETYMTDQGSENQYWASRFLAMRLAGGTKVTFTWIHDAISSYRDSSTVTTSWPSMCTRVIYRLYNLELANAQLLYGHGQMMSRDTTGGNETYAYNRSDLSFELSVPRYCKYLTGTKYTYGTASLRNTYVPSGQSSRVTIDAFFENTDRSPSYSPTEGLYTSFRLSYDNSPSVTQTKTFSWSNLAATGVYNGHQSALYSLTFPIYQESTGYVTTSEMNNAIATLQSNFQDGVDDIYQACISKGSTPASYALADVVAAVQGIPQNPEALPPLYSLRMKLYAGVAKPTTDVEGRNGMYIPLREDGTCNLPFTASPEIVKIVVRFKLSNNSSGNIQALFGAYNGNYWHLPSAEFGSNSGRIGCGFAGSSAWDNWITLDTTVSQDIWYYYEYFWSNAVLFSRLYDDAKNLLEEKSVATAATMYINTNSIFQFGGLLNQSDHYTPGRGLSIDIMKTYVDVNGARVFGSTVGSSNNGMGMVAQAYGTAAVRGNANMTVSAEVAYRTSAFNGG